MKEIMFSIGMTFCLKPGCYAEYKDAHDNLWPEIAESMAVNNVSMVIYLCGDRLFLHAVAPTRADWEKSRQHPALGKWHRYMATLMVTDDQGQSIVDELEPAFSFGMFR
jgi:L-rhamnose mutarotase